MIDVFVDDVNFVDVRDHDEKLRFRKSMKLVSYTLELTHKCRSRIKMVDNAFLAPSIGF